MEFSSKNQIKIEKLKKEIKEKDNIILLIELIEAREIHREMEYSYCLDRKIGIDIDLKSNSIIFLFDDLLDHLIKTNFIVNLKDYKKDNIQNRIDNLSKTEPNNFELLDLKRLYGRMCDSYNYISYLEKANKEIENFDIIKHLLDNKQSELIIKLIFSNKVKLEQKQRLIKKLIADYPELISIFDCPPITYRYATYDSGDYNRKEAFKTALKEKANELLDNADENVNIVRRKYKEKCKDGMSDIHRNKCINFFVENNLVDINNIYWIYDGYSAITSAAASYINGDFRTGERLYLLPEYRKISKQIRDDSDMVIINFLFNRGMSDLIEFLGNPKFESSPEKIEYLLQKIYKNQNSKGFDYTSEYIDKVINILLRKTKKEDYKNVKKIISDLEVNNDIDSLINQRQQFTAKMKVTSETLLNQFPASTKIKHINFQKQN